MLVLTAKHRLHFVGILLALAICATAPTAWAATPITISACPYTITASGGYILSKNLTAMGSCITIAANNVVIDLQGHTITGNGTGYGIVCGANLTGVDHCNNVIVADGTVTQFSKGILLPGNFNTVTSVTVIKSTGAGTNGNGIEVTGTITEPLNVVKNSSSNGNAGIGIAVGGGTNVVTLVIDSTANNNDADGIGAYTVSNSVANNNGGSGIVSPGFVTGSTAQGNALDGITGSGVSVTDSNVSSNGNDGIAVSSTGVGNSGGNVTGSVANNNGNRGIFLTCPAAAFGNTAKNNPGGNLVTSDNTCALLENNAP